MRSSVALRLAAVFALSAGVSLLAAQQSPPKPAKTDAAIRQEIIAASLASYRGSCPCPYNTDRAGRRCGGRSAYSKPGGASPLCFPNDVTQKMIDAYRAAVVKRIPVERATPR